MNSTITTVSEQITIKPQNESLPTRAIKPQITRRYLHTTPKNTHRRTASTILPINNTTAAATCKKLVYVRSYVPQLTAVIIGFVIFIGVIIAYVLLERKRQKTYYGVVDEPEVGVALGMAEEEYVVRSDHSHISAVKADAPKRSPARYNVLKRRKISSDSKPCKPQLTPSAKVTPRKSEKARNSKDDGKSARTQPTNRELECTIEYENIGARGKEVINCLQKWFVEHEAERKSREGSAETNAQLAVLLGEELKDRMQKMTEKEYLVFGFNKEKMCTVTGTENIQSTTSLVIKQTLQFKLMVTEPIDLHILAFECNPEHIVDQTQTRAEEAPEKRVVVEGSKPKGGLSKGTSKVLSLHEKKSGTSSTAPTGKFSNEPQQTVSGDARESVVRRSKTPTRTREHTWVTMGTPSKTRGTPTRATKGTAPKTPIAKGTPKKTSTRTPAPVTPNKGVYQSIGSVAKQGQKTPVKVATITPTMNRTSSPKNTPVILRQPQKQVRQSAQKTVDERNTGSNQK